MPPRLDISNFGPIEHASIEIRPLLILIGQQASGKSTVAKLIYFFQTLSGEFFSRFYSSENPSVNLVQDLIIPIRERFYDFFGSTFHLPDFEITYHYDDEKSLKLSLNKNKKIEAQLSDNFFTKKDRYELSGYKKLLIQIKKEMQLTDGIAKKVMLDERNLNYLHKLSDKINSIFCCGHNDPLYILAGRNATVGYGETFKNMFQQSIQRSIEEQGRRAFKTKEQTIEETLMLRFVEHTEKMKQTLINLGNFEGIIAQSNAKSKNLLKLANRLIHNVLRGQYSNSEFGEIIVHPGKGYVYLKNASSGQQESIRILQDAFLSIYQGNNILRIVEEPEAHLFPEAQMATIQLLALMLNSVPSGNLVLTTHSPYTLTVINNLIYAANVGQTKPDEVNKEIAKSLWLHSENVAAYMLRDGQTIDIIAPETGEIKAEMIDGVSEGINQQYDQIMQYDTNGQEN